MVQKTSLACFKSYDIRGKIPEELDEELAYQIGYAYAHVIKPSSVIIGHDVRLESIPLAMQLEKGLLECGVDVVNIGLCGTEEVYFHVFDKENEGVGGGIMVTASHNPKGYNGMKMVKVGSRPMSWDNDLKKIHDYIVENRNDSSPYIQQHLGEKKVIKDKSKYISHLASYIDMKKLKPLKIVVNGGNSPACLVIKLLEEILPFEFIYMNEEPDGHFPNGVPNPMIVENRVTTSQKVIESKADFGVAWDGDFDRCFLFDQRGRFIEGYYIVGLLAKAFLEKNQGGRVIHDPRLIWNSIDIIESLGGKAVQSKSGHSFIKEKMRLEEAIYGGEMSAHHYFKDFAYCDSGMIPWLLVTELLSTSGAELSELVDNMIKKYPCSGEINYKVDDADKTISKVEEYFKGQGGSFDYTDGVSVEFPKWRFNIRKSNTEPLIRLNLETRSEEISIAEKVSEIKGIIGLYH